MLINEQRIFKVLFAVAMISYIVLLLCYYMDRKRGHE